MAGIRDRAAAIFDYKISKQMVLSLDPGEVLPFLHGWCLSEKTCKQITKINETDRQRAVTELKSGIAHYLLSLDESETDIYEQLEYIVDAFETAKAGPRVINLLRSKLQSLAQGDPPEAESHQGQTSRLPVPVVVSTKEAASSKPIVHSAESPIPGRAVTADADPNAQPQTILLRSRSLAPGDPNSRVRSSASPVPVLTSTEAAASTEPQLSDGSQTIERTEVHPSKITADYGEPVTRSTSVPSLLVPLETRAQEQTASTSQSNLAEQTSSGFPPSSSATNSQVGNLVTKFEQLKTARPEIVVSHQREPLVFPPEDELAVAQSHDEDDSLLSQWMARWAGPSCSQHDSLTAMSSLTVLNEDHYDSYPTTSHESHSANKRILLIGDGGYTSESSQSVESYSPITNTSQLLDIKLRKDRYGHVCGVLSDTEVMVAAGGEAGSSRSRRSTEIIDLQTLRVKAGPSLNIGRCRASSAMYKYGEMYVTGGRKDWSALSSGEVLRRGRWVKIADMMGERWGHGLAAVADYLYAIGGRDGGYLDSVEFYSPQTNQWTLLANKSNYKGEIAAAEHKGVIYAAGGYGKNDLKLCERFDPREDKWHTICDMNVARGGFCLVSYGEKLYAMGGWRNEAGRSIESYDPRVNKWVMEETRLREWRFGSAAVVVPFSL